jgi:hypothetical protein
VLLGDHTGRARRLLTPPGPLPPDESDRPANMTWVIEPRFAGL